VISGGGDERKIFIVISSPLHSEIVIALSESTNKQTTVDKGSTIGTYFPRCIQSTTSSSQHLKRDLLEWLEEQL
jgi:hypothetical protein